MTGGEMDNVMQVRRCPCGVCGCGVELTLLCVELLGSGVIRGVPEEPELRSCGSLVYSR